MKKTIVHVLSLVISLTIVNSAFAQNQVYWREGFEPDQGSTLPTTNPTSILPQPTTDVSYYFEGVGGSWWGKNVYRTTGTSCPAPYGANHPRFRNMGTVGTFDSGALVTPVVNFGIQELHFARARASRAYSIWITPDTAAQTSNWTFIGQMGSWLNPLCQDTTFIVASATAKRLKIVTRPGLDYDIDSIWLTSFSAITLPVTFGAITNSIQNNITTIQWNVETEVNTEMYEVQQSTNGVNFTTIGKVAANNSKLYSYATAAVSGKVFYRIKGVDKDGTTSFSKTTITEFGTISNGLSVYPNPISSKRVNFQVNVAKNDVYTINLISTTGKIVFTQHHTWQQGLQTQQLQLPATIAKGTYLIQVKNATLAYTKTVVVN